MPTVECSDRLKPAAPYMIDGEDVESRADSAPRMRQAVRKVAFHGDKGEDESQDGCCDDVVASTGVGRDKAQEDIDRMWAKNKAIFDSEEDVDFRDLMNVKFAEDSGFNDVPKLWSEGQSMGTRTFYALLAVVFAVYNSEYVIESDFHAMQRLPEVEGHEPFLISRVVWNVGVHTFYPGHHLVSQTRNNQLIGAMELMGLGLLFFQMFHCVILINMPKLSPRYWCLSKDKFATRATRASWLSATVLYTKLIPAISSYSGMRLLHYVQTKALMADISAIRLRPKGIYSGYIAWPWFIISRIFFLVVGFDMFLVKFRVAKAQGVFALHQHDTFSWTSLMRSVLFMKQVLGVLKVDVLVRDRLYLFVFGGPEADMVPKEKAVQLVWEALTTRRIHKKCTDQHGIVLGSLAYMVVMLTFGDEDFQRLTLEPKKKPEQ